MKKLVPLFLLCLVSECSGRGFFDLGISRGGGRARRVFSTESYTSSIGRLRAGDVKKNNIADAATTSTIAQNPSSFVDATEGITPKTTHSQLQSIKNCIVPTTAIVAFSTYGLVTKTFHAIVQWASGNNWFRESLEEVELQSNIITQVVNGPVVVSISVLFATLISTTVSSLQSRQEDVQASLVKEVQCWRQLSTLVYSSLFQAAFSKGEQQVLQDMIDVGQGKVEEEIFMPSRRPSFAAGGRKPNNPHKYIEANTRDISLFCDQLDLAVRRQEQNTQASTNRLNLATTSLAKIRDFLDGVRSERADRWVAVTAMYFPQVHYLALGLLVLAILIAFLVQTDHAEFVFLDGLQLRILWSLLFTCFSSIAILVVDLSDPYSGSFSVKR